MMPHWETSESIAKLFYKAASMYVRFPLGIRMECQLQNHARAGTVMHHSIDSVPPKMTAETAGHTITQRCTRHLSWKENPPILTVL